VGDETVIKKQKIEVTLVVKAVFDLNELSDFESWKDHIIEYGSIIKEKVKIVREAQKASDQKTSR
jgi:hypothetical protein